MVEKILEEKKKVIPEKGWALVGFDDFDRKLYPISKHATKAEAEAALEAKKVERGTTNDDPLYVFEAGDQ